MPNFIEIGQTSLEIGGVIWASDKKFFVTDRNVTTWVAPRSVREARLKAEISCLARLDDSVGT